MAIEFVPKAAVAFQREDEAAAVVAAVLKAEDAS
jgi:hypothetical protein